MNIKMFLNLCGFFVLIFSSLQFIDADYFFGGSSGASTCTSDELADVRSKLSEEKKKSSRLDNDVKQLNDKLTTCNSEKATFAKNADKLNSQRLEEETKSSKSENEVKHLNDKLTTCISEKVALAKDADKFPATQSELFEEKDKNSKLAKKVEHLTGQLSTCNSEKKNLTKEHAEKEGKHAKVENDVQSKLAEEQRKADAVKRAADQEKILIAEKHNAEIKLTKCQEQSRHLEKEKEECDSSKTSLEAAKEQITELKLKEQRQNALAVGFGTVAVLLVLSVGYIFCSLCNRTKAFKIDEQGSTLSFNSNMKRENRPAHPQAPVAQVAQEPLAAIENRNDQAQAGPAQPQAPVAQVAQVPVAQAAQAPVAQVAQAPVAQVAQAPVAARENCDDQAQPGPAQPQAPVAQVAQAPVAARENRGDQAQPGPAQPQAPVVQVAQAPVAQVAQAPVAPIENRDDQAQPSTIEERPVPTAGSADSSVWRRPTLSESNSPVDQVADNCSGQPRSPINTMY